VLELEPQGETKIEELEDSEQLTELEFAVHARDDA